MTILSFNIYSTLTESDFCGVPNNSEAIKLQTNLARLKTPKNLQPRQDGGSFMKNAAARAKAFETASQRKDYSCSP
jgi:hypothetical protein